LKLNFFVLHPIIHCPEIFAKAELEVDEGSTWSNLKEEILPKLLKRDYKRGSIPYDQFSFVISAKHLITEQLRDYYGLNDNDLHNLGSHWHMRATYGLETQIPEVANTFVRMMRESRLDGHSFPSDERMKGVDMVFISIDVDFAIQCPTCKKKGKLGHVYQPWGTDYAYIYTVLDVFCPHCNLKRTVLTYPPIVYSIHDKSGPPLVGIEPRSELIGSQFERSEPEKPDPMREARTRAFRATLKCELCGKIGVNGEFCPNCGAWLCSNGSCREERERRGKCPRCEEPIKGKVSRSNA
jgi:hypothetical protein